MNGTLFLDIAKPLLNIAALNRHTVLHQRIYLFVAVQNHGMPLVSLNPVQNRPVAGKHVAEKPFSTMQSSKTYCVPIPEISIVPSA